MSRKYMIRYRAPIFQPVSYDKLDEKIGSNVGNLVYTAGLIRTLMTEDSLFVSPPKDYILDEKKAEEINENCDAVILNLADALRKNNVPKIEAMTGMIRKLKIPCILIGCGIRAPYEPEEGFVAGIDEAVKAFFSAILERSSIMGFRGELTAAYAKSLGFVEEKDYTVIGCPSMYMYGENLTSREIGDSLEDPGAKISFNLSPSLCDGTLESLERMIAPYRNAVYMPQNSGDCKLMYYGIPRERKSSMAEGWPCTLDHPFYAEHEAYVFNHPSAWIEFERQRDLSIGTRMHGNIAAILAGTPALFLPQDARTRELCEYHGFAHITPDQVFDLTSLSDAVSKVDFRSPLKKQKANFHHYLSFLKQNGLESVFDTDQKDNPFDRRMQEYRFLPPMERIDRVSGEEAQSRKDRWKERESQKTGFWSRLKNKVRKKW